jgi:hypothetical protein
MWITLHAAQAKGKEKTTRYQFLALLCLLSAAKLKFGLSNPFPDALMEVAT